MKISIFVIIIYCNFLFFFIVKYILYLSCTYLCMLVKFIHKFYARFAKVRLKLGILNTFTYIIKGIDNYLKAW